MKTLRKTRINIMYKVNLHRGLSILEILIAVAIVSFVFIPAVQIMYSIQPNNIIDIVRGFGSAVPDGVDQSESNVSRSQFYERGDLQVIFDRGTRWNPMSLADKNFTRHVCMDFNINSNSASPSPHLFLYTKEELGISTSTVLTGAVIIGEKLYLGANSSSTTDPDIFVYDILPSYGSPQDMYALSTIFTNILGGVSRPTLLLTYAKDIGPGSLSIQGKGAHIISANTGVKSQVDIIDTEFVNQKSFVIPGSNSNTSPLTKAVLYAGKNLIVATEKSVLPEIVFFDIDNGQVLRTIETAYGVTDMLLFDNKLIVAGPRDPEIEVFDVKFLSDANTANNNFGQRIGQYDLPGGSGNAKVLSLFGNTLLVGRTKGGNEFVALEMNMFESENDIKESWNKKIGWSIDSLLQFEQYTLLFTADEYKEFQVYELFDSQPMLRSVLDLPSRVTSALCFKNTVWATLRDSEDIGIGGTSYPSAHAPALALIIF